MRFCILITYIILFTWPEVNAIARNFWKNTVENAMGDDDWMNFFYPKIQILDSKGCHNLRDTDHVLSLDDCKYSCPRNVTATKKTCSQKSNGDWDTDTDGGESCICAYTTDSCSDGFKHGTFDPDKVWKTLLGCYPLPLGPPPPAFCDYFAEALPTTKIVPIKEASVINPMIKVMVGKDSDRLCDDGKTIKMSERNSCIFTKQILSYTEATLKPGEGVTLNYSGDNTEYKFVASLNGNQICAEYRGEHANARKMKQCYELKDMPIPKIQSGDDRKLTVIVPGYNHDRPFNLFYGGKNSKTGLFIIKPKRDKNGFIMRDTNGKAIEDPQGDFCLQFTIKPNDYSLLNKDGKVIRLKILEEAFVPVKKTTLKYGKGKIDMWVHDENRSSLFIQETAQNILDTVGSGHDGTFHLRPHMNQQERFKYTSLPVTINGRSTTYVSYEKGKIGKPLFLADKEMQSIRPTSDFNKDLCFKKPKTKTGHKQEPKKEYHEHYIDRYHIIDIYR